MHFWGQVKDIGQIPDINMWVFSGSSPEEIRMVVTMIEVTIKITMRNYVKRHLHFLKYYLIFEKWTLNAHNDQPYTIIIVP